MGQDRLSSLALVNIERETLLNIERETLWRVNFDDVIDEFATVKSRKISLL